MWNREMQSAASEEPMMVKYVEKSPTGIETKSLSRFAISYVLRGTLYLYDGDRRRSVERGEVIFFGIGRHYTEALPDEGGLFEQVVIYYTPSDLQRVLTHLNITYRMTIRSNHSCERCRAGATIVAEAGGALRNYFTSLNGYLREQAMRHDETADNIKMTELVYLITSHGDGCLKSRLLASADRAQECFEQIVYAHVFEPISIEELASKTNRSLTSFKKEFRRHFDTPPHKWFVQQRLNHAQLLLLSTTKSISEIGNECSFPNTSHFIKLFKRAYNTTPASYRHDHPRQAM